MISKIIYLFISLLELTRIGIIQIQTMPNLTHTPHNVLLAPLYSHCFKPFILTVRSCNSAATAERLRMVSLKYCVCIRYFS